MDVGEREDVEGWRGSTLMRPGASALFIFSGLPCSSFMTVTSPANKWLAVDKTVFNEGAEI